MRKIWPRSVPGTLGVQKFRFVAEKIGQLPKRAYAVIVDEAHSSQTGEAARHLKEVLGVKTLEEAEQADVDVEETSDDRVVKSMMSRGPQKNLSYFAFTATPKAKTPEVFVYRGADGKPAPFHLYSMRQAIEEGFILDVLRNYTTYATFYKLAKAIEDDPKVSRKEGTRQLARFMSIHPHNIAQKTEVMIEHFCASVKPGELVLVVGPGQGAGPGRRGGLSTTRRLRRRRGPDRDLPTRGREVCDPRRWVRERDGPIYGPTQVGSRKAKDEDVPSRRSPGAQESGSVRVSPRPSSSSSTR